MTAVPAVTPVTTPVELTVAFGLPVDHTPPGVALLRVMVDVSHTAVGPVIGATTGSVFTVMILAAPIVPQLLVAV